MKIDLSCTNAPWLHAWLLILFQKFSFKWISEVLNPFTGRSDTTNCIFHSKWAMMIWRFHPLRIYLFVCKPKIDIKGFPFFPEINELLFSRRTLKDCWGESFAVLKTLKQNLTRKRNLIHSTTLHTNYFPLSGKRLKQRKR